MIQLRPSTFQDLPQVKNWEADNENSPFVGQWTLMEYQQSLENPNNRHLIIEEIETQTAVGYIILAGLTNPNRIIEFKRIVVQKKGHGIGTTAIYLMLDLVFSDFNAHRLWLDVLEKNIKAKSIYKKCGFKEEGLLRDNQFILNKYVSTYMMSILETEYRALKLNAQIEDSNKKIERN